MSAPVRNGDWVCNGVMGFQGTAEDVSDDILTIRLDPDHGHFCDAVYSQQREAVLVRDYAAQNAERAIRLAAHDVRSAEDEIRSAQQRKREAQARLREARAELRAARRLPVRSPFAKAGTS